MNEQKLKKLLSEYSLSENDFCNFIIGQTIGVTKDGGYDYYETDVERFLRANGIKIKLASKEQQNKIYFQNIESDLSALAADAMAKFKKGREEHDDDLSSIDYDKEIYNELIDLIIYRFLQKRYNPTEKEICICAAIMFENKDGDHLVIRGHRHGDCFLNMSKRPDKKQWKECEQGFITSKNRFVGRIEGRALMDKAGHKSVSEEGYIGNTLFSEDLY